MTPGQGDSWGQAFAAEGNSQAITAGVGNTAVTWNGARQALVWNSGLVPVFFAAGAVAVAPTPGTPANGVPVAPGTTQTFTLPQGTTVIGLITLTSTSLVYMTPGEGE